MIADEKSKDEWRACFVNYYTTNAPSKVAVVTDALMDKWEGEYEKLYSGMKAKYGEPGMAKDVRLSWSVRGTKTTATTTIAKEPDKADSDKKRDLRTVAEVRCLCCSATD